jgi:hypothetical protein|tara:strand:- start:1002 stop:1415 length:414 start_codon:yes stop_codon:yes gene_type:complete
MRTIHTICFGISGTLIGGLAAFIAGLRIESSAGDAIVFILFILTPALSCLAGGLTDFRIAAMIVVYTLIGAFFFGAARPVMAIAPSQQDFYLATRQLSGDIGAWREIIGGCSFAIGRMLFIRDGARKAESTSPGLRT